MLTSKLNTKLTTGIFLLLFFATINSSGQEFYMEANLEARLESILILNVDPEVKIEFEISKINDNLYQITRLPDDIAFSVESTDNWQLSIVASDPYFRGVNNPSQTIPIDFISFHIENRGRNWDNGPFSNIANRTKDTLLPLTREKIVVLTSGSKNNIGGKNRNAFVLRWQFNFEDELAKMRLFSELDIEDDQFVGRFYITLSGTHPTGTSISVPTQGTIPKEKKPSPEISETIAFPGGLSEKKQGKDNKEK